VDLMVLRSSIGYEFCGFMHFDCLWFIGVCSYCDFCDVMVIGEHTI